jgi:conjugal transfer pilus assembly protein TraD
MSEDNFDFENPWRKVYEIPMAASWMGASALTMAAAKMMPLPAKYSMGLAAATAAVGTYRGVQAFKKKRDQRRILSSKVEFITIAEMIKLSRVTQKDKRLWLGKGFQWTDIESSRMHTLIGKGVAAQIGKKRLNGNGSYWLHGLAKEENIYTELANLVGHTLITGATRVGKTRLFDLLIAQAIIRGEPVVIIDPKGDRGLARHAQLICEALGQPERFAYFHPAHPEKSVCIDPLRNWNRKTELASRVAALVPSGSGAGDPFQSFAWKVLNDIINGITAAGQRPNLMSLRRYIEGGPEELVVKALRAYFKKNVKEWERRVQDSIKGQNGNIALGYVQFYKTVVINEFHSADIDGLISTYEHNRDHFQKMVTSLIPVLSKLTSEPIGDLLSPDFEAGHDKLVLDMATAIKKNMVFYISTDSLSDSETGSAIGSVLLADLTAHAGDRYNYGILDELTPINLFVDEAAEAINVPTIQLMNKGGGALFQVTIATQTFADFTVRLGDANKARQVLANTNNKISLRILDGETQQYIADGIPKIKVRNMSVSYGHDIKAQLNDDYKSSYKESSTQEEADLIPPAILGELPPLHFFARLSGGRTLKGRIPILEAEKKKGLFSRMIRRKAA